MKHIIADKYHMRARQVLGTVNVERLASEKSKNASKCIAPQLMIAKLGVIHVLNVQRRLDKNSQMKRRTSTLNPY